ncbi:DMT family transporter [Paenibacillus sp. GCM10027627]|uniref:DMT family transporter n=1 Tax=unclassified Paenibacillus TaxID=185978 RepID=UPI003645D267
MIKNEIKLAYSSAILNAVIIGLSFLFTKIALQHSGPIDTLAYRFAAAFAVMSIPVLLGKIRLQYRGKPIWKMMLLATMYPLAFFTFQTFGLEHATSSEGGILLATAPVLTTLLAAIFIKEKTSTVQKFSILLSVTGVVFIFVMKGSGIAMSNMLGISLLFLSTLSMSGYSVLAKSLLKSYRPSEITYLMLGIGFAVFGTVSVTGHAAAGTLSELWAPLASGTFIASILYLGILSSLVTAMTSNYSLSKLPASKVSVYSNLATVVSIAAGAIFLNEDITWYAIAGSALIIIGVIGTNRTAKPKAASKSSSYQQVEI